jgi:uncharacterized protein YegP (UPF0339 family)
MHWEVVTTRSGYHARLKASNGRIVFWSQDYSAKQSAYEAIQLAREWAASAPVYEVTE